MPADQDGDVGGAGGLAQLPGPHRRTGIAPQMSSHASPHRTPHLGRVDASGGGGPLGGLLAGVGDLALAAQRDPFGGGGAAEDGVLVASGQGHVQAGLADRTAGADGFGGLLGGLVVGLGGEQLQFVRPARRPLKHHRVQGDATG